MMCAPACFNCRYMHHGIFFLLSPSPPLCARTCFLSSCQRSPGLSLWPVITDLFVKNYKLDVDITHLYTCNCALWPVFRLIHQRNTWSVFPLVFCLWDFRLHTWFKHTEVPSWFFVPVSGIFVAHWDSIQLPSVFEYIDSIPQSATSSRDAWYTAWELALVHLAPLHRTMKYNSGPYDRFPLQQWSVSSRSKWKSGRK